MRMFLPACVLAAASLAPAQVNNYGLTLQGGGQFAGRACNSASCNSSQVRVTAGTQVAIDVWGSPQSFYAVAVSVPSNFCQPIPGIANDLMLSQPVDTLAIGVLNQPAGPSICLAIQESATINATLPAGASGLTFRLQALTIGGVGSNTGPVFTESIDLSVL